MSFSYKCLLKVFNEKAIKINFKILKIDTSGIILGVCNQDKYKTEFKIKFTEIVKSYDL